jgi:hypothetical protein
MNTPLPTSTFSASPNHKGLSPGAIAAIGTSIGVFVLVAAIVAGYLLGQRRGSKFSAQPSATSVSKTQSDLDDHNRGFAPKSELHAQCTAELEVPLAEMNANWPHEVAELPSNGTG